MGKALQRVKQLLAASSSPAVLSSFGKDSMLLLDLVREVRPNTPVLWFRTGQNETFARRIIRQWNLMVFSWLPERYYLLRGPQGTVLIHEYNFGGDRLPVLVDLKPGEPCKTQPRGHSNRPVYLPFDALLVGWKDSDEHWVKGNAPLDLDGYQLGRATMYAPLRHMTDEAVRAAVIDRDIPFQPVDDELPACDHCLTGRPCNEIAVGDIVTFRNSYNLARKEEEV